MRLTLPRRATVSAAALLAGGLLSGDLQAQSERCAGEVDSHLAELPLAPGDVKSVRIAEQMNPEDTGPEILGVEGRVRLNSCSGWLIIDMRPTCYIRQTYTRGDCQIEGVPNY